MTGSEETNDEITFMYSNTKVDSMMTDMDLDDRGGTRYDNDDEIDDDDDYDDDDDDDDEVERKDRMIAKEAALSRWASRAAATKGSVSSLKYPSLELEVGQVKQVRHQKQQKQHQQKQNQNQKQQAQQINVICQTWRNVKNAIGSALLQNLAQHQRHQRRQNINNHKKFNNHTNNNNNNNSNSKIKRCVTSTSKTKLSETLAEIQISSALQSHLDRIGNTGSTSATMKNNAANDTRTKISKDTTTHIPRRVLDILPSGYDRTFAWSSSVQNRTRAFLLLDLGGVIKSVLRFVSLTSFHTHYRSSKINIQPQFRVTLNPNIELLKLLVSLGVDLRCNTVDDVLAADLALKEEKDQDDQEDENVENDRNDDEEEETSTAYPSGATLVDDAAKTRKPDGYFRRLFTTWSHDLDKHQPPSRRNHMEVAIDGPEEVVRISNAVKRFAARHAANYIRNSTLLGDGDGNGKTCTTTISHGNSGTNMGPVTSCRFVLRLPTTPMNDDGTWERLILSTHSAAIEQGGELVGVSVNLSPWSQKIMNLDKIADISTNTVAPVSLEEQETNQTLKLMCHHLRIFRLLLLSLRQFHIRIDLTGFPSPLTRTQAHSLTHALSTIVSCDVTMEELEQVHLDSSSLELEQLREQANNGKICSVRYTADVSEQLVADCGALCTRIIGVKRGAKSNSSISSPSGSLQEKKEQTSDSSEVFLNYYIDDGCYGSLGSSCSPSDTTTSSGVNSSLGNTTLPVPSIKKQHMPVPLYGGKMPRLPPAFPTLKKKVEKPTSAISRSNNNISNIRASDSKSNSRGVTGQYGETFSSINDTSNFVKATVWGPTCDGLDKVCESVLLPPDLEANRDWLVFPHLGCGGFGGGLGLGTAFNGFDPPDTAYCVLNYFSRGR